ncbi:CdaR family transcriptional regulator [Microbispora sp. H11081]|uniref:PucR family transcriptional regulator n=1 Tax=Microbispora sp. H11081 TaxID=2729107 RepID=UPI001473C068|nr:PucR family transcriptional regulator [Microbispora sp. H11081]
MPTRIAPSGARIGRIVDDLGLILTKVLLPADLAGRLVDSAEILEIGKAGEPPPPRSLVLGVGVGPGDLTKELVERLAGRGVIALLVRDGPEMQQRFRELGGRPPIGLLAVDRQASWFHVAGLIRERISMGTLGLGHAEDASQAYKDLSQIANAVGALIRAPLIIQDLDFRVLAFSQHQENVDRARAATVLGQSLPDEYRRILDEVNAIERVYGSHEPELITLGYGLQPRLAVAIRSGTDILGSMWAAVPGPVDAARVSAFAEAASVVALALLRFRAEVSARKRIRSGHMVTMLSDQHAAPDARARLGLAAREVVVLAVSADDLERSFPDGLQRLASAFDLHLSTAEQLAVAAAIDNAVYGVVPTQPGGPGTSAAIRIARGFLSRMKLPGLRVGIGRPARTTEGIIRSRRDAEVTLMSMRATGDPEPVRSFEDVVLGATLLNVREYYVQQEIPIPSGAVAAILEYDRRHHSDMVATLAAYLGSLGDVAETARRLNVHVNTVRYRLRRLREVAGLDHTDPDQMFLAGLQLRLMDMTDRGAGADPAG